ncbi:hypothetical protein GQ457_10G004460 [Hibiscus cannabinus]
MKLPSMDKVFFLVKLGAFNWVSTSNNDLVIVESMWWDCPWFCAPCVRRLAPQIETEPQEGADKGKVL